MVQAIDYMDPVKSFRGPPVLWNEALDVLLLACGARLWSQICLRRGDTSGEGRKHPTENALQK